MNTTSWTNKLGSWLVRAIGDHLFGSAKQEARFVILIYHRILEQSDDLLQSEPDLSSFRWQMEALASNFNVIGLSEALVRLQGGNLPPRTVCITFDDGYRSTHDLAMPILRELGLPACVFIATQYIDGSNMWNDRITEAVRKIPWGTLDLRSLNLGLGVHQLECAADRIRSAEQLIGKAKYMSAVERNKLTAHLESLVAGMTGKRLMLSTEMIRNLGDNGFEIGGHTVTHPILTKLDDRTALQEIVQCKQELEAITGHPVRLFAYPNGKAGMDYDERHVQMARQAGYDAAFITALGSVEKHTDRYQIPRGRPWDQSPLLFQLRLLRWLAQSH